MNFFTDEELEIIQKTKLRYPEYTTNSQRAKDYTGKIFGRLKVLYRYESIKRPNGGTRSCWVCLCLNDNNIVIVQTDKLKSGHTQSCGCLAKETSKKNAEKNFLIFDITPNEYELINDTYYIGYTTKHEKFYFDKEDYDLVYKYRWYLNSNGYVTNADIGFMHNLIMNDIIGIDHINHNVADNRKCNLRNANSSQNSINRSIQKNNTSGITGVYYHKPSNKWVGYIKLNGQQIRKYANNKEEAIKLRKELEDQYFKNWSYENSMKYSNSYSLKE